MQSYFANSLFPSEPEASSTDASSSLPAPTSYKTGVLPSQELRELIKKHRIRAAVEEITEDQIQPASLDLRLGSTAYRIPASFLPGHSFKVEDKIRAVAQHELDLSGPDGAVLEKNCVYIVPLMEALLLPKRTHGFANPKSSTGRIDVFTRLITDYATQFDTVEAQYQGPLYAEISPRAFSIRVRKGSRLLQLRVKHGSPRPSDEAVRRLQESQGVVDVESGEERIFRASIHISIDLVGANSGGLVGFRGKRNAGIIDCDLTQAYDVLDYWEPIYSEGNKGIILDLSDFYILASKETISIPRDHAAEMVAYDTLVGEFRVHYAGFFDPGFGEKDCGGTGTRAVLEVRPHEVPFMIEDGQVVGRLVLERLKEVPDKLYGQGIGSSYQRQGLALSKHFRPYRPAR